MRVFKVPFDIKREEKIFRWVFKYKTSYLPYASMFKFCNHYYSIANSI